MMIKGAISEIESVLEFFNRSSSCLTEADVNFAPKEGMFSVIQITAHIARTIEWFAEGAFNPSGFDMDFESHCKDLDKVKTLKEAREWVQSAVNQVIDLLNTKSEADWLAPLPAGPVMGGAPRIAIVGAIVDHTAHHRGALSVYSRLLGKEPKMPYMD